MQKAGMLTEGKGLAYFLGVTLFVLFLFMMLFLYCRRYFPSYAFEREGIFLVGSVVIAFLVICQVIMLLGA